MSVRIDSYTALGSGTYGTVSRVTVLPPSAHAISQTVWAGKWMDRLPAEIMSWHQIILSEVCVPQSSALPRVVGAWANAAGIMIVMDGFESNAVDLMKTTVDPVPLLRDVCRGLVDLHEAGVAHRDVKLDNILLRKGRAFLCDFGLSSCIYAPVSENDSQICTFMTRAPEIWSKAPNSFGADMWSLGCVGYNLATRKNILSMDAETRVRGDVVEYLRTFSLPSATHPAYTTNSLAAFYIVARCLQFDSTLRPLPRELITSIADCRRRRIPRSRPTSVIPPPMTLTGSKTFPLQSYLSGETFVGRPTSRLLVVSTHRRAELSAIRGTLAKLDDDTFKTLLVTTDLFDRLPHKSLRTRICMAIYVCGIASNCAHTMRAIVVALWKDDVRVAEMEALFLPALASLGWRLGSHDTCTYTLLQTMGLHDDADIQEKIMAEYLRWPDARRRSDMIRDALCST